MIKEEAERLDNVPVCVGPVTLGELRLISTNITILAALLEQKESNYFERRLVQLQMCADVLERLKKDAMDQIVGHKTEG